ncbi:MAG: 50S ribosomal protein L23 [Chlamydiales bacterium]|nr:50S ribosomal protein L23 [Chlamydiales bacterium]
MSKRSPFDIIKSRYVTEKAKVLEQLKTNSSNACVRKCETPKYVFLVDKKANKQEIADAVEEIYAEKKINVTKVNTVTVKQKPRRIRGRIGHKAGFKKAIVSLKPGDSLDEKV